MVDEIPSVDAVFCAAIEIESDEERDEYISKACGQDAELLRQVDRLLRAHYSAGSFLQSPPEGAASPTIDQPLTEKSGTVIGPYKLLQKIGEGGMGIVYMAEQTEPVERRVALKIIKPGMDTRQVIARFEAEQQALAMMDHPNIAKVLDAGTTDTGRPYFVMELVKGVPVTQYCDEKQLTPRERLELFVPVCQAAQHAHQKGIIHRDIKPSNVLVAEYDDRAIPKIIDFGVAKATQQRLTEKTVFTELGQVVGTIEYMSPEQAKLNQLDIDTRTDIYSLGVLLYELLTGETPFDAIQLRSAAFDEMLRIIREEEPPRPSLKLSASESLPAIAANRHVEPKKLGTLVHGELDWIVMKALEKDRARRYETASNFAEDVEHYLHDEAVSACPPSAAYRLRKFARRNKVAIAMTAATAALLLLGIVGTSWQAIRATHQRDRAVAAEAKTEEEAKRAETEAVIAKAVNDFLQEDLLGMASSASQAEAQLSPDPDIKLRTLLDRAAGKIEERFADQPRVQAEICRTIGNAYRSIGEYEKAETFLRQALEIHRRTLGAEHLDTIKSMNNLASVYGNQGRYEEAEGLFRQTLEIRHRTLGDEHLDTLKNMHNLAIAYAQQGREPDAVTLFKQTLEIFRRTLGEEHPSTLTNMQCLATAYKAQGRYEEAESLVRQSLDVQSRTLGKKHPGTLLSMLTLVTICIEERRYEEAETLSRQTLEISRRTLGEEHPDTLIIMASLATAYRGQDRYEEAEALLRQALEISRRTLGREHPETLRIMHNLAHVYLDQGSFKRAARLYDQTLEGRRRTLGKEHPDTVETLRNLSLLSWPLATAADRAERDPPKALELAKLATELQPKVANTWDNLGVALYRNGQFSEAVETLEKARTMRGGKDPNHQFFLAMAHWQTGQRDKARENYTEAALWLKSGDRDKEQHRFQAEAESLIKPNETQEDAQSEAGNQELSNQ